MTAKPNVLCSLYVAHGKIVSNFSLKCQVQTKESELTDADVDMLSAPPSRLSARPNDVKSMHAPLQIDADLPAPGQRTIDVFRQSSGRARLIGVRRQAPVVNLSRPALKVHFEIGMTEISALKLAG